METSQNSDEPLSARIQSLRSRLHKMEGFSPVEKITPAEEQTLRLVQIKERENVNS